jgi:hypothetical protein
MMDTSTIVNFGIGAVIGYYVVKHYLKVGKPA